MDYYIPPKEKIKTFRDFEKQCFELYDMYEPWFHLQGFDCFTNFKGNEIDRDCWYCTVKLRSEHPTHTVLTFQPGDDIDYPFAVFSDWAECDFITSWSPLGFYTECKEYYDITCAFYDMVQGYSRFHIRALHDLLMISEKGDHEHAVFDEHSLLSGIDYILTDPKFKGKTMDIFQNKPVGEELLYRTTVPIE